MKYQLCIALFLVALSTTIHAQETDEDYQIRCFNQKYTNTELTFEIEIRNASRRAVKAWISEGNVGEDNVWQVIPAVHNDSIKMDFEYELVNDGSEKIVKPMIGLEKYHQGLKIRRRRSQIIRAKVSIQGNVKSLEYMQFIIAIQDRTKHYHMKSVEFNFRYQKFIYT